MRFLKILVLLNLAIGFIVMSNIWSINKVQATTSVTISLKNTTKAYNGTTLGMGGTVFPFGYHSSWQVKDFNDDDLNAIMTKFKKTGATYVRLWVDGSWWEPVNDDSDPNTFNDSGFTWNSTEMQCLYKYIQAFKDVGVDCYVDVMSQDPRLMYPWLLAAEDFGCGPKRSMVGEYAENVAAVVRQLCIVKGLTNVKYISIAGEPNNFFQDELGDNLTNYKNCITALHSRLYNENLLQYVKVIAPEIGYNDADAGEWIENLATDINSSIDAYTIHSGQTKAEAIDGSYCNLLTSFIDKIKAHDPNGADKPFMITDYTPSGTIRRAEDGLNSVALICNGLRTGVSTFGRWSFAEDIWTWPCLANQTSTSFGDHGYGIIGSKQENYTPKPAYKAIALAYKFLPKDSTTYKATTTNESIIPAMIKTSDGKYTIVLVNWSSSDANATFMLDSSISETFRKYRFNSADMGLMDKFGEIPTSFGTITVNGTSFTDTVPANSIYFYTNIPDSTAPGQTVGLSASSPDFTKATLTWTARTDSDLAYYRIYRSETSGFTPSLSNKVGEIWVKSGDTPTFTDKNIDQFKTYYYKVSAVDTSENEGAFSEQASVTIGGETYSNTLSVTDNTTYGYYEINADYEGGYKVRVYKKAGVIGYLQDKLGHSRQNLSFDLYSVPMALKYSSSAYSEKVQNGGAESGSNNPYNWYNWNDQNGTFTWDGNVKHSGSYSLKMYNSSTAANSCWYQNIGSVTPLTVYQVSYWCKTDSVTGPTDAGRGCYLNFQFFDSNGTSIKSAGGYDSIVNTGTNDWLYFTSSVTAPPGAVSAQVSCMLYGNSGTAWFDDISIRELPVNAITGQRPNLYQADSVTYNNISSGHKQIVTVVGSETLYYDFYSDRIEMKVIGPNPGGYYIEDGGIVPRNVAAAYWSDGTESVMSDTWAGTTVTKNTTSLMIYQPSSPQTICYQFASSKPVTLVNGSRFRGYYPRFQVNSNEVFILKFNKKLDNSNGSAEAGTTVPSDWNTWNQSGYGSFTWDSAVYHWGSKSLKTTNTQTDNSAWYSIVNNINQRRTYRLSGWLKTSSVSGANGAFLYVQTQDSSGTVTGNYITPYITGTNDWKRYELTFNPPAGTTKLLVHGCLYNATGTAWFDDFELNYADNGLYNAGGETGSSNPTDWNTWSSSGTPFTWDSSTYNTGKRSLKIDNTSNQYSCWYMDMTNLQISKEYEFGGWIKTSGVVAGSFGAEIEAIALDSNGNWIAAQITSVLSETNNWTYVTGKITLPPMTQKVQLQAQLYGVNGTAWFDDLFIRLVDKS